MFDTAETRHTGTGLLTHDRPCPHCGHALHTYLACGDGCECHPARPLVNH